MTSIEEETPLDSIPAAAKPGYEKKIASGKITMVEAVSKGGPVSFYEAQYATKRWQETGSGREARRQPEQGITFASTSFVSALSSLRERANHHSVQLRARTRAWSQ